MLKKIIKEIKDIENNAEKILEEAKKESEKLINDERQNQERIRNEKIDQWNKEGQEIVEYRTKKAQEKAKEIKGNCAKEKEWIRNSTEKKFDKAIKMILDKLVR